MTLTNFPNGISTSTISADTIDFPASGTVIASEGTITDVVATTAEIGTINVGTSTPVTGIFVQAATLSPASVAANTTAEQTFAVANLGTADVIVGVNKPTAQAGLGIVGARVSSAGSIGITFANVTTAAITPTGSQVYQIASIKHG